MITGEIKNRIDGIWDTFWTGGITNSITILEQITKMSDEERRKLSTILKTTELSSITNTIDLLQTRGRALRSLNPVVGECNDASLNARAWASLRSSYHAPTPGAFPFLKASRSSVSIPSPRR